MRRSMPVLLALAMLIALCGCGKKSDVQKAIAETEKSTKDCNELADILTTVKDTATFEAAKPRLKQILERQREQMKKNLDLAKSKMKDVKAPTREDMEKARKEAERLKSDPDYPKLEAATQALMQAVQRYVTEQLRCMKIPEFGKWWQQESGMGAMGG